MNKVPTAEEFLKSKGYISDNHNFNREIDFLIEFAKLHVQQALKTALLKHDLTYEKDEYGVEAFLDHNSILNAYPLEKIK